MPEDRISPLPQEGENVERNENEESNGNGERFISDTQKIVRRHLENEDDIITDEDIRNVRVGMTPPAADAATEARFEDEEAREEIEDEYVGDKQEEDRDKKDENLDNIQITPWDTIDPTR